MSDALNYLIKTRPETISHYFAFLKQTGTHLDPKTRNLISVITKVYSQTDRGFRQYLGRALREGCTPMEVLDALLMAFPALGLAKITWAVDIILDMKIPGFDPDVITQKTPAVAEWRDVMASKDIKDGEVTRTECQGRGLFIYRDKKSYQVYDSHCPHQNTDITQLAVKGTTLTCPKHQWQFDAKSGDCIKKGNTPLSRIESKVVKGRLLAFW
ncbi:Rieske 2Fe-2S domain-containing protein [Rhodoferax sp.]|uniref:Rieske 2Fe-2S domain-containing protein n=1 Tax=Rhodoferax sp. TaxID=50421 RepID=UPI0008BAEF64|nr:Rieske 2Fe-2S domain-containing protein [Rhodoferax sp.]MDO8319722.1 Rieske 2Fe-2S domain-containing protein [Rhodoferax sp.]OGB37695.1 MAG: carboxymuconolactone decarboxylase [Burkholderiales bacterium RIFOXYC2_FULL_59_8]OGB84621.1 MAG: carboxymuconolactone decarboxylase [Burkholderiales bacterium RIFOXYD2_FULL_59_8]